MMLPQFDRRLVLKGALGSAALGVAPKEALGAISSPLSNSDGFIRFENEIEAFKAHFRLERDLRDSGQTLTWYHFTVYTVPESDRPAPLVRYEGIEFSYYKRVGPLTWVMQAHNLSFPRSIVDGSFVDSVRNPLTGETVSVPVMTILDDPGVLYGPSGYLPLDSSSGNWLKSYKLFRYEGDRVVADHVRAAPESWPKTFLEASTTWFSRREFEDPTVTSIPCEFSGFYTFPWPKWLRMGDRPGRMLGSWLGRKLPSVAALPPSFAARARAEFPELLRPRLARLETPIPPVAAAALAAIRP